MCFKDLQSIFKFTARTSKCRTCLTLPAASLDIAPIDTTSTKPALPKNEWRMLTALTTSRSSKMLRSTSAVWPNSWSWWTKKRTPRFNSCTSCTSCLIIQSSCLCLGIAAENGLFTWTHPWPLQAACLVKLGSIYVLAVFVLAEILLAGWTESCITADSTKSNTPWFEPPMIRSFRNNLDPDCVGRDGQSAPATCSYPKRWVCKLLAAVKIIA